MKGQWKKTLIRMLISLIMIGLSWQSTIPVTPWMFLGGFYIGLNALCNLASAVALSVKPDARAYIPFSAAAVVLSVLITLGAVSELSYATESMFLAAGALMMVLLFVPYLLVMAAAAYIKGKKPEAGLPELLRRKEYEQ